MEKDNSPVQTTGFIVPYDAICLAVCCAKGKRPNVMTLQATSPDQPPGQIWLGIRHACFSSSIIKESREFVAAFPSEDLLYETDRVGCVSGRDQDKFVTCKLAALPADIVSTPLLAGCRLNIECRVTDVVQIAENRDRFVGEIVAIHARPDCLQADGTTPDIDKCKPLVQRHGHYWTWGYKQKLDKFFYTAP
jgi:flavin reductase (DIM6/NTAB) family NADH-FMN oxidoreductase RutF